MINPTTGKGTAIRVKRRRINERVITIVLMRCLCRGGALQQRLVRVSTPSEILMITLIIINQHSLVTHHQSAKFVVLTSSCTTPGSSILYYYIYVGVDFIFWRIQRRDPYQLPTNPTPSRPPAYSEGCGVSCGPELLMMMVA